MTVKEPHCELGVIGMGTMGRNLALNIADHGFPVAVYNRTPEKTREFMAAAPGRRIYPAEELAGFSRLLKQPRAVLLLVPAGPPVDAMITALQPHLEPGDLIVDAGNSHFSDTERRGHLLAELGLLFLGLGISGGEEGARLGPSLMPGGPWEAYQRLQPVLEAVAAKVKGEPCVAYLGGGSSGHYVKMVHNGIEYGVMQLLAESYDLLKYGLGLDNDALHEVFARWQQGEAASYLVDITARIFRQPDDRGEGRLLDSILDRAGQKGTGVWTSMEALALQVPAPTLDMAVMMRALSDLKSERENASKILGRAGALRQEDRQNFPARLEKAFQAAMIVTYAQGLALLHQASRRYDYHLHLGQVAKVWRGGCIIRADLLEDIMAAFERDPGLVNLLLDPNLGQKVVLRQEDWRAVVAAATLAGIPVSGLGASLSYFDAYRRARLPANLIQAQRDYFGAHTYERLDAPGTFHTQWDQG